MGMGRLSATEARVATLVASGRTDREIAKSLAVRIDVLESHIAEVYRKLGVASRTEIAVLFGERIAKGASAGDPNGEEIGHGLSRDHGKAAPYGDPAADPADAIGQRVQRAEVEKGD